MSFPDLFNDCSNITQLADLLTPKTAAGGKIKFVQKTDGRHLTRLDLKGEVPLIAIFDKLKQIAPPCSDPTSYSKPVSRIFQLLKPETPSKLSSFFSSLSLSKSKSQKELEDKTKASEEAIFSLLEGCYFPKKMSEPELKTARASTNYAFLGKDLPHARDSFASPKTSNTKSGEADKKSQEAAKKEDKVVFPPVPDINRDGLRENPLSKRLRRLDNPKLAQRVSSDMGVYINTNEVNLEQTRSSLALKPKVQGSVHVGFSGWHNFDIMALRESSCAFLPDLNPENKLFLSQVLLLLRRCPNRFYFVDQMVAFVKKYNHLDCILFRRDLALSISFLPNTSDDPLYRDIYSSDPDDTGQITVELQRPGSWLYTDSRYQHIRTLALTDCIAVITENILATHKFQEMRKLMEANGRHIDTVYIANIPEYMWEYADKLSLIESMQAMVEDETVVIYSDLEKQQTIAGKRLKEKDFRPLFGEFWDRFGPALPSKQAS